MEEFNSFFEEMRNNKSDFLLQSNRSGSGEYPLYFESGHEEYLVFKENRYQSIFPLLIRKITTSKFIGLIRNPGAVLNSWRKNPKEFPADADFNKEWRHGMCKNQGPQDYFGYYKWKEVANMYLDLAEQYPQRVLVQKYEDLVNDPLVYGKKLLEFCDLEFNIDVENFIIKSTLIDNESYYSVFKTSSVQDKWKSELPEKIKTEIYYDLLGTRLEIFNK